MKIRPTLDSGAQRPGTTRSTRADRRTSFEHIALALAPALLRTARRHTRQPDDASDVVQETFLRAYRTFDNFQEGTNAKAWLFTILYSILANRWQRAHRTPEELSADDVEARFGLALASTAPDPEHALLERLDASPEIETALGDLPDAYRAAVLLVDVEELTYEEAATALACPVGTVRSRLARGRKALFVALSDYAKRTRTLQDV